MFTKTFLLFVFFVLFTPLISAQVDVNDFNYEFIDSNQFNKSRYIALKWSTGLESEANIFRIEKAHLPKSKILDYSIILEVDAKNVETNQIFNSINYSLKDENLIKDSTIVYRLSHEDKSGSIVILDSVYAPDLFKGTIKFKYLGNDYLELNKLFEREEKLFEEVMVGVRYKYSNSHASYGTVRHQKHCKLLSISDDEVIFGVKLDYVSFYRANKAGIKKTLPDMEFTNLRSISFSNNEFVGSLPSIIAPNLQGFSLDYGNISGKVPLYDWPNLRNFSVRNNNLSGSFPSFLSNDLETIVLRSNNFSGEVPNFNYPNLRILDLEDNNFSGEIHNWYAPNLRVLRLGVNNFSGEIPDFNYPKLYSLFISSSDLEGDIPFFTSNDLREVNITNSKISGSIPNLPSESLEYISLYSNKLTGGIPSFNSNKIDRAIFSNNLLSGEININLKQQGLLMVENNKFTFGKLEKYTKVTNHFHYSPQDTVLPIKQNNKGIEVVVDGSANTYQWYKNGEPIEGENSNVLNFEKINGTVKCEVKNTILPQLTLWSQEYILTNFNENSTAVSLIQESDRLEIELGSNYNNTKIKLYDLNGIEQFSEIINSKYHSINIEHLIPGIYFLKVKSGNINFVEKILKQ